LIKVNELKIRNAELESKSKAVEHQFQARVAALLSANNVLRAKTSALETETASLRRVAGHQAQRNPLEEANSLIQRLEAEVADLKYRARRNALAALGGGTGSNSSNGSNGDAQAYFKLVVLVELGYVVGTPWQKHKWGHLASA
jgi:polyhydroxyalkanoate synthesis regulator phasin